MNNKKLRRIVLGTTAAFMTVGLIAGVSTDANARNSEGDYIFVPTKCVCMATDEEVGDSNDCDPGGHQECWDNNCDGLSC